MTHMTDLEKFGKNVLIKCRDEIMDGHNNFKSLDINRFQNIGDTELKTNQIERKELLDSLTPKQMAALDKLLLNTIDNFAFNLLREFQENKISQNSDNYDIVINGKTSLEMEEDLVSGNLFGDYFTWTKHSKYGRFQN